MKKIFIPALLFSVFSLFAEPYVLENGLKFLNRHYSDDELDSMFFPEVTVKNYELLYHNGIVNKTNANVYFDRDLDYQSPLLTLENDKTGKQWFHLMLDPGIYYDINAPHGDEKTKTAIEIRTPSYLKNDTFVDFSFMADSQSSYNESLAIVKLTVEINNKWRGLYSVKLKKGRIYACFNDVDESVKPGESKFPKLVYREVDLGPLGNFDTGKMRIAQKRGEIFISFNDKTASSKVSTFLDRNSGVHYRIGLMPKTVNPAFYEMFISDIDFVVADN